MATRLGSKGDFNEIINHPFFRDVDFEKLLKKEIPAPYKPSIELLTSKENENMLNDPNLKDIKTEDD